MSIVTKKGDSGKTALFFGGRVFKDDPRPELNGILDELSSFLGLAKCAIKERKAKKCIETIQKGLYCIGAEVATTPKFTKKLKHRIVPADIKFLEKAIKEVESRVRLKECSFCLPGEDLLSSCLDISRTIARQAERRAVTLFRKKMMKNRSVMVYLNRLSDLLYLMAREREPRTKVVKARR